MAAKTKARTKRTGAGRKGVRKTMNQFASSALKKSKSIERDAEAAAGEAGEWVSEKAAYVRDTVKSQPMLFGALALGAIGWFIGRRSAS